MVDAAARFNATVVMMRHSISSSGILKVVQSMVEDPLFKCNKVFSTKNDESLYSLKNPELCSFPSAFMHPQ